MNNYNVIGRLTRDPELKTVGDSRLAKFDIAVDTGTKAKPKTLFLSINVWGKTADIVEQYVAKGHRVGLSGRLEMDQWEDKEGNKRSKVFMTAERLDLLQNRDPDDQRPTGKRESGYGEEAQAEPEPSTFEDETVPF